MTMRNLSVAAGLCLTLAGSCLAQSVMSARSGTVHTFEGSVSIDGKAVEKKVSIFPEVKEKSTLSTARGRAEVLLTPGVFLRVGENSSIKMIDSRLVSTRVEVIAGSAVLEEVDSEVNRKGNSVTIIFRDYEVSLRKNGLMEIYSDPPQMKVYKGEADVVAVGSQPVVRSIVKEGRMVTFNPVLVTEKFDEKSGDDLLLWSRDRSQSLSAANMASANAYRNRGNFGNGFGSGGYSSNSWYFNQAYGMFTFLPFAGTFYSPWGYGYYSPYSIYDVYYPGGYTWTGGGAANTLAGVSLAHVPSGTMTSTLRNTGHLSGPTHSGGPVSAVLEGSRTAASARGWSPGMNSSPSYGSMNSGSSGLSNSGASASMASHASAGVSASGGGGGAAHSSGGGHR